jgi:hypothetical protein
VPASFLLSGATAKPVWPLRTFEIGLTTWPNDTQGRDAREPSSQGQNRHRVPAARAIEERSVVADDVSPEALFKAAPWRTFRWYLGQRHHSGMWWSSTDRGHVIYESRLDLANLVLADFDPAVHHIVAQPFMLRPVTARHSRETHRVARP